MASIIDQPPHCTLPRSTKWIRGADCPSQGRSGADVVVHHDVCLWAQPEKAGTDIFHVLWVRMREN